MLPMFVNRKSNDACKIGPGGASSLLDIIIQDASGHFVWSTEEDCFIYLVGMFC